MMTSDQVRALADAGMEIGAHTSLASDPAPASTRCAHEIEGAGGLEIITGRRWGVCLPEWPAGRRLQRAGSRLLSRWGSTTRRRRAGARTSKTDVYQLPRFTPWDPSRFAGSQAAAGVSRRRLETSAIRRVHPAARVPAPSGSTPIRRSTTRALRGAAAGRPAGTRAGR